MLWVRLLQVFQLILLAAAGCTNANLPETQTSVGGSAPSRPSTVIINSFTYSPDITGVDRELVARLEGKFGSMSYDVIKSLAAKRVSDEIVATTIVIVHAAGLNARPGNDQPTSMNGALVINGQLRALDQTNRERRSVTFGGGDRIVADITVAQVSEGGEKQMLSFTAQAQAGPEPNAALLGAAIAKVLADKSAADVTLPPKIEALARGLGRTVADRVVTYGQERGWVSEANLPAASEDARTEKKKLEKRPQSATGQDKATSAETKIPCEAFRKNARGNWYVSGPVTIDIGSAKRRTLQDVEISPKFYTIGGADLYDVVQKECGNL